MGLTTTVSEEFAGILQRYGVTHVFGQSLPTRLLQAAEAQGIRQVLYRTENAGGAMADGYARVSRRVGIVTAQNGPAATLLVPPLAEAKMVSIPVVALVQEVARGSRDRNAFQEFDHEALFSSCTKWTRRVDSPDRLADDLALAFSVATSGRPGPVALLIPKDVLTLPGAGQSARTHVLGGFPLDRPRPAAEAVERAARLLAEARQPLIVAGGGVHVSGAHDALAAIQEEASLPVATSTMGKGAVDETHELSIGVIGSFMGPNSLTRSQRPWVQDSDVILLVGTRTNENGTDSWRLFPEGARYIHLDIAAEEPGRNYESVRLVGDARAGLEDLREALHRVGLERRTAARAAVAERLASTRAADRAAAQTVLASDASPIRPERVVAELDRLIDADTILVADASYSTIWMAAYLTSRRPGQRFLTPRGLAGLGWGFPMALGAQLAEPDATVVCLAGDGGFGHTWQELETAARENLPVVTILLNNSILGFQKHAELLETGAHTSAVAFGPVDHNGIAEACGVAARRVSDPAELAGALAEALARRAPGLIEVITDPDAYPPITAWEGSANLP